MKKILLAGVAITLLLAGVAASADWRQGHYIPYDISKDPVAKLAWNAANIDKLRAFDKAAIIRFAFAGIDRSDELLDFGWFDLAGDGRYQLAVISSIGRGPNWLDINWQDAPGKMRKDGGTHSLEPPRNSARRLGTSMATASWRSSSLPR